MMKSRIIHASLWCTDMRFLEEIFFERCFFPNHINRFIFFCCHEIYRNYELMKHKKIAKVESMPTKIYIYMYRYIYKFSSKAKERRREGGKESTFHKKRIYRKRKRRSIYQTTSNLNGEPGMWLSPHLQTRTYSPFSLRM